jgi:hypothetical protein
VVGCETISVTYILEGEEPVTVEVIGFINEIGDYEYVWTIYQPGLYDGSGNVVFSQDFGFWYFNAEGIQAKLFEDTPCPFGTYTIEEGSIFESFKVEPIL